MKDLARELVERKEDGRIKLYVTYRTLHCRRENPGLFTTGDYLPLEVNGANHDHVFAFARRKGNRSAVVVVPRLVVGLAPDGKPPLGKEVWGSTALVLPASLTGGRWVNLFTGEAAAGTDHAGQPGLRVADVLGHFPVALLVTQLA